MAMVVLLLSPNARRAARCMVAVAPAALDATRYSLTVRRIWLARALLLLPLLCSGVACLPGATDGTPSGAQAGLSAAPPLQATRPATAPSARALRPGAPARAPPAWPRPQRRRP